MATREELQTFVTDYSRGKGVDTIPLRPSALDNASNADLEGDAGKAVRLMKTTGFVAPKPFDEEDR